MNEPITRRRALRTGGLAAIAASLLGNTTTVPAVAAQPAPAVPWLGSVAAPDLAAMTAESQRLSGLCRDTLTEAAKAAADLGDVLTPEQLVLSNASDNALGEHYGATFDWYMAEIGRHLPGIAPAIFAVWEHVREERGACVCCMPNVEGSES